MPEPKFDPESVDRAFAELVAGYHLTADRPDPPPADPERAWAEDHPLFAVAGTAHGGEAPAEEVPEPPVDERVERYEPEPLPPLARPGLPSLLGWIGIGFAALMVLAAGFGLRPPSWVGWLAVAGFVCGFTLLLTQLPRHRPPEAGDGAVL